MTTNTLASLHEVKMTVDNIDLPELSGGYVAGEIKPLHAVISTNANLAYSLLFKDPETGEELRPYIEPSTNSHGAFCIYVQNKDGTRKWKHSIITEELS